MNLREDIERIKEVMGINESRDMFLRRRRKEFIDAILQSYEWIDVGEAGSFQEYLEEVLMNAIDGFFDYNNILIKHVEMEELLPMALRILQNDEWLFRRIRRHYDTYNSSRNFDETITESKDRFLMRREFEFNRYLNHHFGNVNPQRFDSFEDYLKYVLRYAIMIFFSNVGNEGDLKPYEMEELMPIALHHLENNRDLYNEIKKEFFKELNSEQQSEKSESVINEINDINFFKRRKKSVMGELQRMFDSIPPIYNDSLVDYVDQLVLEAIISLYNRGGQSEGVSQELIYQVHPIVKEMLLDNKVLLNKIKNQFKLYHPFKSTQMNESKELDFIKRRMDTLLDYIEASYDWLSPRRFSSFDEFLNRVVFSATRDFLADEMRGEYEDQLEVREDLEPIILEFIKKHPIYDEIYDHYISNQENKFFDSSDE